MNNLSFRYLQSIFSFIKIFYQNYYIITYILMLRSKDPQKKTVILNSDFQFPPTPRHCQSHFFKRRFTKASQML